MEVTKLEGGKISISIAQVSEVMKHLADLCTLEDNLKTFLDYVEYRRKENRRKDAR